MRRRHSSFLDEFNSTTCQNNIKDLDITEQGLSGSPSAGSSFYTFLSLNFSNAIDCPAEYLKGFNYSIYFDEVHRYLLPTEFDTTALPLGGFRILIPSFDATAGNYHFFVSTIATPGGNAIIGEPITLQQAKDHVRVTFADDDAILTRLISSARAAIENYCNISIVQKNIKMLADLVTGDLQLPNGPVINVVSITDSNGNLVDPLSYQVTGSRFKHINFAYAQYYNCMVEYNTGYSAGLESDLQLAILNEIAFRYDNRGEGEQLRNNVNPGVCEAARILANPYRKMTWR